MGRINIGNSHGDHEKFPLGQIKFDNEINIDRAYKVIDKVIHKSTEIDKSKGIYIYGMGSQSKKIYDVINEMPEVELLWTDSRLPSILSVLKFIIASYAGIIKINDIKPLKDIFFSLGHNAMVGLYIFDTILEEQFVNTIKMNIYPEIADKIAFKDPQNFIYQIDTDNSESFTGIYEIISYGIECPFFLQEIVKNNT